ncbi:hypothetical protein N7488_006577 [Penicillium malachiteum]|nr:hypothetical protein N7488_006577 [Penicillium malachiteum]
MSTESWALYDKPADSTSPEISISPNSASISNGKIRAVISKFGKLTISYSAGKVLLEEYTRTRRNILDAKAPANSTSFFAA